MDKAVIKGMDPKDLNTRETEYKTGSNEIHYIGTLTRDDGSNVRSGSENQFTDQLTETLIH